MTVPETDRSLPQLLVAALLAGLVATVAFALFSWARLFFVREVDTAGRILVGVLWGTPLALASHVPFLLAVILVLAAGPDWRVVTAGAGLVYTVEFALAAVGRLLGPFGFSPAVLVAPGTRVASFLAIATAVWVAYRGGSAWLADRLGNPSHPLLGIVGETSIGTELDLRRGVLAAVLGALVATGGLVLVRWVGNALRAPSGGVELRLAGSPAGIALEQGLVVLVAEASFLLAVLFVVGPRPRPSDVPKGVAVLFAVQTPLRLAPALLPPFQPVDLWEAQGPVLAPLADAIVLVALAVAVWLAFGDGIERLRDRTSLSRAPG